MYLVAKVQKAHKDSTKLIQCAQLTLKKKHHLVVEDLPIPHDYKLKPICKGHHTLPKSD